MIKFTHSNLCCERIRMRRSQSALEYLMTYGWSILVIVIVAAVLYGMGVFNPRASFSSSITGFSGLGSVTAQCIGGQGLSVQLGDTLPATINITGINVTDSITSQSFSVNPYLIIPQGSFNLFYVPSVCPVPNEPFSAQVTVTYTEPGQTFPGPYFISGSVSGRSVSSGISGSPSLAAAVPIKLTNTQSSATPSPFQEMLNVTSFSYKSYEASNLQNIEFFYPNGTVIPSWLESGNSYTSNSTIYWLRIGSIPSGSSKTVYMGFSSTSSNLLNGINIGEAPQLSSTYGEYDDGANVFNNYWNFVGTSLPNGWSEQANGNIITINNGITMTTTGSYYVSYVWYNTPLNPQISVLEAEFKNATSNGAAHDETIDWVSSNSFPTTAGWPSTPFIAAGMHDAFEIYNGSDQQSGNTQFTPVLVSIEYNSSNSATPLFNYSLENVPREFASSLMSSAYPTIELNWGGYNTLSIFYLRTRAYPPNGVMPSVTYEKLI